MIDLSSINGLTQDSREVKQGTLFAAFKGEHSDGRDYIDAAIEQGATVILTDLSLRSSTKQSHADLRFIFDDNPRKAFAHLCADFYALNGAGQPRTITAVTGTNGKTSIVHFTQQIWQALGLNAASLGTLSGKMTTADPVSLHAELCDLAQSGITHLAIEASSHGLHQHRIDGVKVKAAGFTNLSRDHLDYHNTMDEYLTAKSRLFTEILPPDGIAVLNADIPEFEELKSKIKTKIWTYGRSGEDFKILSITPTAHGQNCELKILNETYRIDINLVGEFQIMNALCALGLVLASTSNQGNVDTQKAIQSLATITGARGRLERVGDAPIYVDYAHTPDALEHVLTALRPHTQNRLICIFGCGGDRDTGKRPQMGKIAATLADQVIITDDNPRSENPATIRAEILKAAPNATEIANRRDAIQQTIKTLADGDVLLVAGKGHEQGQIFATHTDPFDDVTEIQTALQSI